MKSSIELLQYGREASERYVKDNISLDTSIQKLANQHGLNNNEIARVAEEANIKTYLSLIKTAKDNYVEFPLASTHVKNISMTKTAEYEYISDDTYADILPNVEYDMLKVAGVTNETADVYTCYDSQTEFRKHAQQLEAVINYSTNTMLEENATLDNMFIKLSNLAEQHVLQGNAIGEVNTIIKTAAPNTGEYLVKSIIDGLVSKIGDGFTKIACTKEVFDVNPNTEIFKLAKDYNIKTQFLIKVAEACEDNIKIYNTYVQDNKLAGYDKYESLEKIASATSKVKLALISVPVGAVTSSLILPKSTTASEIFLNKDNASKIMQSARRTIL